MPNIFVYPSYKVDAERVTLFARFVDTDSPFKRGATTEVRREIVIPRPTGFRADLAILTAIRQAFPDATVDWHTETPQPPESPEALTPPSR